MDSFYVLLINYVLIVKESPHCANYGLQYNLSVRFQLLGSVGEWVIGFDFLY